MKLFVAAVLLSLFGAEPQNPSRDPQSKATAAWKGELTVTVTTDEPSPKPLRRVSVSIQAGELDIPRTVVTDDDGRVVFRDIAAGNYLVSANRPGYVRTYYGSRSVGRGPGVAVAVVEGKANPAVRVRMLRGGVITGAIRTISGRPAPNLTVMAALAPNASGRSVISLPESILNTATTDDRGVYRIYNLPPGSYIVSVQTTLLSSSPADMRQVTSEEIQWADKVLASPAAAAGAPAPDPGPGPQPAPGVAYAPVFYPGTTVANEASAVTLGPNEERSGVDFGLQFVPTAVVSGRLLDPEGQPRPNESVRLALESLSDLDFFESMGRNNAQTGADGTFTLRGVRPGRYALTARATIRTGPPPAAGSEVMSFAAIMPGSGGTHWASQDIAVAGRDLTDLTLQLQPGMTITGRIVHEATAEKPPSDLSRVMLTLTQANPNAGNGALSMLVSSMMGNAPAKVEKDGTFVIEGVAPGRYRLTTAAGMMAAFIPTAAQLSPWALKSAVTTSGLDLADLAFDVKPGESLSGVVVTFTDRMTELTGTVYDSLGRATPGFPIIVFSTDRRAWITGSRRVQQIRPASDGRFKAVGLPPGEYFVSAVTSVEQSELFDPVFLEQLVSSAFKITLKDGEKKTQDLKLGGG